MSTRFTELLNLPQLSDLYINEGLNSPFKYTEPNSVNDGRTLSSVYATLANSFSKTDFVRLLEKRFGNVVARYLKNPPHSIYDWHIDKNRLCTINWIVKSNTDARVWYRSNNQHRLFWDLEEITYQEHYPTIFDTSVEHSVFNNSDEERIILSLSLTDGPTYQEVVDFLTSLKITQY